MMPPTQAPRGLMAGMQQGGDTPPDALAGASPPVDDRRQHDNQEAEQTEGGNREEPNVTPEEQAAFDEFVTTGLELIYEGGQVKPGILKLLDDDPSDLIKILGRDVPELGERFSPVIALAATATIVVMEVVKRLKEHPDGSIIMHAGKELLEELGDLADDVNGKDFTQDELNQAYLHAVDLYQAIGTADGTVDKELASQEFADILNAQEQGQLDKVLPGLERGR